MSDDIAARYRAIRISTAKLLNYDVGTLTSAEMVRLDRATVLRLELDTLASKQLAGQQIDTGKYTAASETLEVLIRSAHPGQASDGTDDALTKLEELIAGYARVAEEDEVREVERLKGELARKDAEIERLKGGEAVAPVATEATLPPVGQAPPPSPPPEPTKPYKPTPEPSNVVRIDEPHVKSSRPREPWRDHIAADGSINAPWFGRTAKGD